MGDIVKEIINGLPQIVQFFVPGAIFLSVFYFITYTKVKQDDSKYFVFKSIIASYIIFGTTNFLSQLIFNLFHTIVLGRLYQFICAVVLGYIVAKFYESVLFDKILKYLGIARNVQPDFWKDVIDYKNGTYIKAYPKTDEKVYYGSVYKVEESEGNRYIMLKECDVLDINGNVLIYGSVEENGVIFNTSDLGKIEIEYSPKSNKKSR